MLCLKEFSELDEEVAKVAAPSYLQGAELEERSGDDEQSDEMTRSLWMTMKEQRVTIPHPIPVLNGKIERERRLNQ